MEQWKKIIDHYYEVSSHGRVWSWKTNRYIKLQADDRGYIGFCIHKNAISKPVRVHRLVAEYFIDKIPDKPHVNHKDGNKTNNHISNLEWVSKKDNTRHAVMMGLIPTGPKHWNSKLSGRVRVSVKKLHDAGFSYSEIGRRYHVCYSTISRAINGRRENLLNNFEV